MLPLETPPLCASGPRRRGGGSLDLEMPTGRPAGRPGGRRQGRLVGPKWHVAVYKSPNFCKIFIGFALLGEPHQEIVEVLMFFDGICGAFGGNDQKSSRNNRVYKHLGNSQKLYIYINSLEMY